MTAQDLDSAIAFPFLPFRRRSVDLDGFQKNVRYVIGHCALASGRRVIATGGGTLLHHLSAAEQLSLAGIAGDEAGDRAWFISGIVPTPLRDAEQLIRRQMELRRPPDLFLLLPLIGGYNPDGVARDLGNLCRELGRDGARFVLYLRDSALRDACCRLVQSCEFVVGTKIGTTVEDAAAVRRALGPDAAVVWGVGDLSNAAARCGTRGHTSGISVLCAEASDALHNAQSAGDFETAARIEADLRPIEEIRFMQSRAYNYSAIHEALRVLAFPDVEAGEGAPFNAPTPPEIAARVRDAAAGLRRYH